MSNREAEGNVAQPPPAAMDAADPDRLGAAIGLAALAAVLLHATQLSFNILPHAEKGQGVFVSPVDFVLAAGILLWAVRRLLRRDFSWPPIGVALLGTVWLALSLLPSLKGKGQDILVLKSGVKEVLQFAEYFIAGYILFVESVRRAEWRRRAVWILLAAVAVSIVAAGVQYFSKDVAATAVRGAGFANRNTFGLFLALALPLVFGVSVFRLRAPARLGVSLLLLVALCVVLAGGPFLALCLGLLTVAALRSRGKFVVTAILLLLAGALLLPRLPRHNPDALLDSVALYRETDPHHIFRDDIAVVSQRLSDKQSALGRKVLDKQPVDYGDVPTEQDFSWKWSQRYKEWQAALSVIVRSPWFGVGAGSYQKNVNQYYGAMPKYPKNFMEPDAGSLYAVWGASAGVPFLMILLLMFLHAGRSAGRVFFRCADRFDRGLAAGLIGSLVALAVAGVFGDPLVRGLGVTVALLLALAQALRETAVEKAAQ